LEFGKLYGKCLAFETGGRLSKDDKRMEAPTSPAGSQYLSYCALNKVIVRALSSSLVVHVQLRGTQEAVRHESPTPRDYVQRMHEERLSNVDSLRPVKSA
jgi:hypothetical protein